MPTVSNSLLAELQRLADRVEQITLPDGSTPDTLGARAAIALALGEPFLADKRSFADEPESAVRVVTETMFGRTEEDFPTVAAAADWIGLCAVNGVECRIIPLKGR